MCALCICCRVNIVTNICHTYNQSPSDLWSAKDGEIVDANDIEKEGWLTKRGGIVKVVYISPFSLWPSLYIYISYTN